MNSDYTFNEEHFSFTAFKQTTQNCATYRIADQGLANELIEREVIIGIESGNIECRERLGGMLKYCR